MLKNIHKIAARMYSGAVQCKALGLINNGPRAVNIDSRIINRPIT
jgi:hypothetical protein